jgi:pSer/pThr/pTyr-binding forkhead associated (FHA) protein
VRKSDGFYVKDMGSLNHTFVNGVKLQQNEPKKLESGYLIQLADEVFEWHCD